MPNLYELQNVPLTPDTRVRPLYFHTRGGDHLLPVVSDDRKGITLPGGCEFDLNTYFGSFYECYWRRYTPVKEVFLTFHLHGKARVRLYRFSPEIKEVCLYEADLIGTGETFVIPVSEPGTYPTTHGRIHARFLARHDNVTISDLSWQTPLPPQREVNLEATMCVYNRDRDLADTLGNLAVLQRENLVQQITVINHAENGLRERLEKLLPDHAKGMTFKLIDQPNTGSPGGMARSMIEAIESGACNYLLRLDDDIFIDPHTFRRLPLLLRWLNDKVAIGSYMLNKLEPTRNFTIGYGINFHDIFPAASRHREDIISPKALDLYAQVEFCDYVSWWCMAFAVKEIAATGFPMPIFTQFDDVDYGPRLRKNGVESVNWPGVCVWHDPPYVKQSALKFYYFLRNQLFLRERHKVFDKKQILQSFGKLFTNYIMLFYYARAWAVVQAMEDFIEGPQALAEWTPEVHRRLAAEEKRWSEPDIPRPVRLLPAVLTGKPPKRAWMQPFCVVLRILGDLFRPARPNAPLRFVDYWHGWGVWAGAGQDRIAVSHDRDDVCHVYVRDPKKIRALLFRYFKARFAFAAGRVGRRDRAATDALTTEAWWRERLGLPRKETAPAAESGSSFLRKAS